jgi:hypothetical protein
MNIIKNKLKIVIVIILILLIILIYRLSYIEYENFELNNTGESKIAFLFLTYNNLKRPDIWNNFFGIDGNNKSKYSDKYTIYNHAKEPEKVTDILLKDRHIPEHIETCWGCFNLVEANILMMKEALKDPRNKKFILVSDSCIPIVSYDTFYNELMKDDKSRINIHKGNYHIYHELINPPFEKEDFIIHNGSSAIINLKHTNILSNSLLEYKNIWTKSRCPDEHYNGNVLQLKDKDFNLHNNPVKITFDTWSKDKLEIENICNDKNNENGENGENGKNNETICTYTDEGYSSPSIIDKISNKMIDELRNKQFLLIRKVNENTKIDIEYLLK